MRPCVFNASRDCPWMCLAVTCVGTGHGDSKGEKNIILDLSKCNYCDSSGLRSVLVGNRLCEDAIGTFILCGLQPDVENLVKISMLDSILIITNSFEEAKELLEKKGNLK